MDSEQVVCIDFTDGALQGELQYLCYPCGWQGFLCGLQPTVGGGVFDGGLQVVVGIYGGDRHSRQCLPDGEANEEGEYYVPALFHLCVCSVTLNNLIHQSEQVVPILGSEELYAGLFEVWQSFEYGRGGKVSS